MTDYLSCSKEQDVGVSTIVGNQIQAHINLPF